MEQYLAMAIMFLITVLMSTLFTIPITMFPRKSRVLNFYWCGFWGFLALIAALSGASSMLMIWDGVNPVLFDPIIHSVIGAHVLFVIVAWFHLSGKLALTAVNFIRPLLPIAQHKAPV